MVPAKIQMAFHISKMRSRYRRLPILSKSSYPRYNMRYPEDSVESTWPASCWRKTLHGLAFEETWLISFLLDCLACYPNQAKITRPLAETLPADRPNEILHINHLYIGAVYAEELDRTVLQDDLGGYFWISSTAFPSAEHTSATFVRCMRKFTPLAYWVFDRGSHFY